ncbi:type II toxin-antitoxin system RelE/ParE family toxin [Oceaniglobus trochenteri]|uniref:type II toxin-antitoxin system RelE/ParE family toxin n=1 Tax=Oceaniglobus trochenteri TaxID=2763260 RepID=UPI001FD91166|nr:type II toxin-antitoxin system RelE/ParE family toxin [Oceaniglobus trochenteri]
MLKEGRYGSTSERIRASLRLMEVQEGARQADSCLNDIDRALSGLAVHPLPGADCPDLMQGARRLVTGRHVAFYRVEGERIFVIRVLHQSMDAWRRLRER